MKGEEYNLDRAESTFWVYSPRENVTYLSYDFNEVCGYLNEA